MYTWERTSRVVCRLRLEFVKIHGVGSPSSGKGECFFLPIRAVDADSNDQCPLDPYLLPAFFFLTFFRDELGEWMWTWPFKISNCTESISTARSP